MEADGRAAAPTILPPDPRGAHKENPSIVALGKKKETKTNAEAAKEICVTRTELARRIDRNSVEHLSNIYRTSIEHLLDIYRKSVKSLQTMIFMLL